MSLVTLAISAAGQTPVIICYSPTSGWRVLYKTIIIPVSLSPLPGVFQKKLSKLPFSNSRTPWPSEHTVEVFQKKFALIVWLSLSCGWFYENKMLF